MLAAPSAALLTIDKFGPPSTYSLLSQRRCKGKCSHLKHADRLTLKMVIEGKRRCRTCDRVMKGYSRCPCCNYPLQRNLRGAEPRRRAEKALAIVRY